MATKKNIYGHPLSDRFGDDYDSYHVHHVHGVQGEPVADDVSDQLPLFSQVGRGIQGDSYKVEIASDSTDATYLKGSRFDAALKEWIDEWQSENVNGGCLNYKYQTYLDTTPPAFTITFMYTRPGRVEWEWTSPLIPYLPEDDNIITIGSLSRILSVSENSIKWLIDNKDENIGDDEDTGIDGTEHDFLDYLKERLEEVYSALEDEAIVRRLADNTLDEAIKVEETSRSEADDELKGYVDDEIAKINPCDCDMEALEEKIEKVASDAQAAVEDESASRTEADEALRKYIDDEATSTIVQKTTTTVTNEITNNTTNYIYGEKLSVFIGDDLQIASKDHGDLAVEIPFSTSVGDAKKMQLKDNVVVINNETGSEPLRVMVCAQMAAQFSDDAYGISGGIHQWVTGSEDYKDIAQSQFTGTANSQDMNTLVILPVVTEVPAGQSNTFDLSCRPLGPSEWEGTIDIAGAPTRSYMTFSII